MNNYTIIPAFALCIYVFLFLSFIAAQKTKVINGFVLVLLAFIAWTGGSLLMRMEMWPSYEFWYHVSIFGLVFLPFCFYYFIHFLTDSKDTKFLWIWFFVSLANGVINLVFDLFVPCPSLEVMENGETAFVYDIGWPVIILFLSVSIVVVHMLVLMIRYSRNDEKTRKLMQPIFLGIAILFLGHILLLIPAFSGFPIDVLSGVVNAFCMFYALYKSKMFRLTLLVSRGTCYAVIVALCVILFTSWIEPVSVFVENHLGIQNTQNITFAVAVIFALMAFFIYNSIRKYIDNVFIKDEMVQADGLKDFALAVSKSLYVDEIVNELLHAVQNTISVDRAYVFIREYDTDVFGMVKSSVPMEHSQFKIKADNPVMQWLSSNNQSLKWEEFKEEEAYASMGENEKILLNGMDIGYLVPLKDEKELIGVLMIAGKEKAEGLNVTDMPFLNSVKSIASIAIKNSRLYEKAYHEARTDELTGLLNRKYFYLTLEKEVEQNEKGSLALVILNVDDFKLYNQLYGNEEGDRALSKIAGIIRKNVGEKGYVARYSGKEFAVILPEYDAFSARNLAESIRLQILDMNKKETELELKVITVSGGICTFPHSASNAKQLVEYADMAVYNAKRKGKNSILVYDIDTDRHTLEAKQNIGFKEGVYSSYESTIMALTAAIDAKDHYTFDHSQNVAYYAMELAKEYGLNKEMVEIIREAGLLHDIGKIGIHENILNKKGKLTEEEFEVIKGHVEQSINIIRHLPSLDYVIPAVIGHHERYDGNGYPRRIGGEDIPLSARILCIADSFDAMVSKRSYKEAYTLEYAIKELQKNAGSQFDPDLVQIFIRLLDSGKVTIQNNKNKKE